MDLFGVRPVDDSPHGLQSGVSHPAGHDQIVVEHHTGVATPDACKFSGDGARAASSAPEIPVEELRRLAQTHGTKHHASRGMQSRKFLFFAVAMIVSGGAAAFHYYSEEGMAAVNSASFAVAPLSSQPADTQSSSHTITKASTAPVIEPRPAQQATAIPPPSEAAPLDPPPKMVQQFEAVLRDLEVVQQTLQQMTSKQDDMAHNIAALQASNDELKKKLTSYRLTGVRRAPATQPRKPAVNAASVQTVGQPSVPHTTVVEAPASSNGSEPDARWPGVSRPPSALRDN